MRRLNEITVLEALDLLKRREATSVDITNACLEKINLIDKKIKAFVTVTKDIALKQAQEADKLIKEKGAIIFDSKPLLGIPYAIS